MMWLLGIRGKLIGIGLAVLAFLGALMRAKSEGKAEAYDEVQERDRARADGVRKRVSDVDGVQPSDIRYRD